MSEISLRGLTKRFGDTDAVRDLTVDVPSGRITGFLGPNGAGKTTTLRMLLGLVRPTAGEALIDGVPYVRLVQPRRKVGALLEATGLHPGRNGRDHLRVLAGPIGASRDRVEEVLAQVELTQDAGRRVGGYSLGMRQRLGLAAALLGDPEVLVLDEPANGLDPAGMAWLRSMLREFAAQGRTVLVSSHVLSEVAQTVDHVIIINRGELRFVGPVGQLGGGVSVRTAEADRLRVALERHGGQVVTSGGTSLEVADVTAEQVGRIAADEGITLSALSDGGASLEAAFLRLTSPLGAEVASESLPADSR